LWEWSGIADNLDQSPGGAQLHAMVDPARLCADQGRIHGDTAREARSLGGINDCVFVPPVIFPEEGSFEVESGTPPD